MVKQIIRIAILVCSLIAVSSTSQSRVVINEVLANPIGGENSLQWIEMFNDSAFGKSLMGYRIETSTHIFTLADSLILQPFEYYIVCRQLFSSLSAPGFESKWGDSSGSWGNSPYESVLQKPLVVSLTLNKTADYVRLYNGSNALESEIVWNNSSDEGISLERKKPDSLTVAPSEDITGSTPFDINSITPVGYDLALRLPSVRSSLGNTSISFTVKNSGYDTVRNASLTLLRSTADTITTILLPDISPGDSSIQQWNGHFSGLYVDLSASLSADDRSRNNSVAFTAAGDLFPPFTLSEIAPSERDGIQSEWIELHKRLSTPVDIAGWRIRTEHGEAVIAPFTQYISDEYFILAKNRFDFMASYPNVTATVIEVADWVTLINDAGTVSLVDSYGILADSFSYSNGNDILVWSKADTSVQSHWGASSIQQGTPGEPNQIAVASDSSVTLTVSPQILATDEFGNGNMHITFTAPENTAITLKIFDRGGKAVRTFFDAAKISERMIIWQGDDDANHRLTVGMYILYLQAGTAKAIKQPVVIAR